MNYFPNSIMQEMFLMLSSDSMLVGSNFLITKGEPLNTDQNISPWIGVLRGSREYGGERIGSTTPYGGLFNINVYHQEYSELPFSETWDRVEDGESQIISLVTSKGNLTLNGTVDVLQGFTTEPLFFNEQLDQRFITNLITLSYKIRL